MDTGSHRRPSPSKWPAFVFLVAVTSGAGTACLRFPDIPAKASDPQTGTSGGEHASASTSFTGSGGTTSTTMGPNTESGSTGGTTGTGGTGTLTSTATHGGTTTTSSTGSDDTGSSAAESITTGDQVDTTGTSGDSTSDTTQTWDGSEDSEESTGSTSDTTGPDSETSGASDDTDGESTESSSDDSQDDTSTDADSTSDDGDQDDDDDDDDDDAFICGNGELEGDEDCDDGPDNGTPGHCNANCSFECRGPCPWFVDADATGSNANGHDWSRAFPSIQQAIDRASAGEPIFVAAGRYVQQDADADQPLVRLSPGVEVYGGFTGTERTLDERDDPRAHPSVLDGEEILSTIVWAASNARLDGFRLVRGRATGSLLDTTDPRAQGAGVYAARARGFQLVSCDLNDHEATQSAALFIYLSRDVSIRDCRFDDNVAQRFGAMGVIETIDLTIRDSSFARNHTKVGDGGAIGSRHSTLSIHDCDFFDNVAHDIGGALYLERRDADDSPHEALIEGSRFAGNASTGVGAGAYAGTRTSLEIRDGWFEANTSVEGGPAVAGSSFGATIVVDGSTFLNNEATGDPDNPENAGGGAIASAGTLIVGNSHFQANRSVADGGAISVRGDHESGLSITNCLFFDNSTTDGRASAIYGGGDDPGISRALNIVNSSFIANRGPDAVPDIHTHDDTSFVVNSVHLGGGPPSTRGAIDPWSSAGDCCVLGPGEVEDHFAIERGEDGLTRHFLPALSPCLEIGDPAHLADIPAPIEFDWRTTTTRLDRRPDGEDEQLDAGFHHPATARPHFGATGDQ